jgi:RND family efflux transporter MFP subunit
MMGPGQARHSGCGYLPCIFIGLAGAALPYPARAHECLIMPSQVVEVRSPVEGLIGRVFVKRGDVINPGQALVELKSDAERSAASVMLYRSQMTGRIEAARNRLEYATKKLERLQELHNEKFMSAQARDEAETEKRLADAELREAVENQKLAILEYQHAIEVLDLRTLRSPFKGVVVERTLNPGDLAESGTGRKPILKIAQIIPLRVEVVLPIDVFGKLSLGTQATVIPEKLGGQYAATISVVDKVADAASGTFGVQLELPNRDGKLLGGIRCQVEFPALKGPRGETGNR